MYVNVDSLIHHSTEPVLMYVNVYFRATLDLMKLDKDHTHDITVNLVDQVGRLRMLVTITGAVSSTDHEVSPTMRDEITRRYVSTPQHMCLQYLHHRRFVCLFILHGHLAALILLNNDYHKSCPPLL